MFHWNIDPILLNLGAIKLHWYGLLFASSLLIAYFMGEWMFKREKQDVKLLEQLFIYIVVGLTVGARLAHVLFYDLDYYLAHPLEVIQIWKGGLASHGGFLGVFIAIWLFCKRYNMSFLWVVSRAALPAMLVASFIRLGNFFNSEIVGKATNANWGVVFDRVDTIPRHPVVLYESISYFLIFLLLLYLYKKLPAQRYTNIAIGLVLTLGFSARFVLEYFKTAQSEFANDLPVTMGQLLSIPYIVVGLILLFFALKNR